MMRLPLDRLQRQMNSFQQATGGDRPRPRAAGDAAARVVDGAGATFADGALVGRARRRVVRVRATSPVLRDVSFRIEPGEVLGLLGRTGSGKTTISRLLFRLHDPVDRRRPARRRPTSATRELDELRSRIALVTQDVQLFEGTLRDNVALFDERCPDDRLARGLRGARPGRVVARAVRTGSTPSSAPAGAGCRPARRSSSRSRACS